MESMPAPRTLQPPDKYAGKPDLPDNVSAASVSLTENAPGVVSNNIAVLMTPAGMDQVAKKTANNKTAQFVLLWVVTCIFHRHFCCGLFVDKEQITRKI